jgi:hypothetical protein
VVANILCLLGEGNNLLDLSKRRDFSITTRQEIEATVVASVLCVPVRFAKI